MVPLIEGPFLGVLSGAAAAVFVLALEWETLLFVLILLLLFVLLFPGLLLLGINALNSLVNNSASASNP